MLYLLSSEKDKNVPLHFFTDMDLNDCPNGSFEVIPLWLWRVEDLNRVGTTRDTLVCVCVCVCVCVSVGV